MDKTNGEVVLTMGVSNMDGITLYDSLILYIYDDPLVYAGNDTIIFADAQLELTSALAQYHEFVYWITTGDGVFNYDTTTKPCVFSGRC